MKSKIPYSGLWRATLIVFNPTDRVNRFSLSAGQTLRSEWVEPHSYGLIVLTRNLPVEAEVTAEVGGLLVSRFSLEDQEAGDGLL